MDLGYGTAITHALQSWTQQLLKWCYIQYELFFSGMAGLEAPLSEYLEGGTISSVDLLIDMDQGNTDMVIPRVNTGSYSQNTLRSTLLDLHSIPPATRNAPRRAPK